MPDDARPDGAGPGRLPPDDKNWTWVLDRACPDCGYDGPGVARDDLAAGVRSVAARWVDQLGRPDVRVRTRPDRWSVLEYGCHVRDVFRISDERLALLVERDAPVFADWDQDRTALADRYDLQDPADVARALAVAAAVLADRLDSITGGQWERRATRSDGSGFSVGTLGVYLLHDPVHHLWDVTGT